MIVECHANGFSNSLRQKVRRFLRSHQYNRREVLRFIEEAKCFGDVAIFGGMLRDMAAFGRRGFSSDVDVVIRPFHSGGIESLAEKMDAKKNKFGGYRAKLGCWMVDFWNVEDTWAFSQGIVEGSGFKDLVRTTFFTTDAVVYELTSGKLHYSDEFLPHISNRVLDINLEHNPNQIGAVLRTFRSLVNRETVLAPRLYQYIMNCISNYEDIDLMQYERRSYFRPVLSQHSLCCIRAELDRHWRGRYEKYFQLPADLVSHRLPF